MTDLIERAKAMQARLGAWGADYPHGSPGNILLHEAAAIIGELIALVEATAEKRNR